MTVRVFIKRHVPKNKEDQLKPLLKELRNHAMNQDGYITGETLKRIDRPGESIVISTWRSMDDWRKWVLSEERSKFQDHIEHLLGEKTEFEIYTFE